MAALWQWRGIAMSIRSRIPSAGAGYIFAAAFGAVLFCIYWWAIGRTLEKRGVAAKAEPIPGAQQQDVKRGDTKPGKRESNNKNGERKKKGEVHNTAVQQSQGDSSPNIIVQQHTEGPNSPIANSPVTINPPVNPNAPVVTYDFDGVRHTQIGNRFIAEVGEETTRFQDMAALEKQRRWDDLRKQAESQIKTVPSWLTPYLFAAEAYANLGNRTKAVELCEYVKKQSGGNPAFNQPADKLLNLLGQP
jgi:hypothetical protein